MWWVMTAGIQAGLPRGEVRASPVPPQGDECPRYWAGRGTCHGGKMARDRVASRAKRCSGSGPWLGACTQSTRAHGVPRAGDRRAFPGKEDLRSSWAPGAIAEAFGCSLTHSANASCPFSVPGARLAVGQGGVRPGPGCQSCHGTHWVPVRRWGPCHGTVGAWGPEGGSRSLPEEVVSKEAFQDMPGLSRAETEGAADAGTLG